MDFQQKECYTIGDLEHIIALLRAPGGCPWDIEQTHQSVRANLIEETYEAVEAIDTNNMELLKEELGDVLMQVLFHAQMEAEQGTFTFADVVDGVAKKLIVRHPHVFGNVQVTDSSQVLSNWDEIKKKTKSQTTQTEVLESVSVALPALMRSYKVQKKAAKVGVDVSDANAALDQIIARAQELKQTLSKQQDSNLLEHQVGDLLFSAVNVASNMELLKEELGDVLMQVLFHAQMEAEQGTFTFADVVDGVAKKLIVRHPHVFGNVQVTDSSQVLSNWDEIKKKTKSQTTQTEVLESVSVALPALMRSYKVQKKAAKVGVDVSDANAALDQIIARAQELKQTLSKQQDSNLLEHQVGDLLFSAVNVARKCEVEPEYSLTNACNRFIIYFTAVEKYTQEKQLCWSDLTPQELNSIWQRVTTEQFSQ